MPSAGAIVAAFNDVEWAQVQTEETSSSTSYTDLATSGPAVTVALAAGQSALILISCGLFLDTSPAGARARMSWAVSGAETISASDNNSIFTSIPADYVYSMRSALFTATTGGDYTFTAKYKVGGAVTGTWAGRDLIVIPLPKAP